MDKVCCPSKSWLLEDVNGKASCSTLQHCVNHFFIFVLETIEDFVEISQILTRVNVVNWHIV